MTSPDDIASFDAHGAGWHVGAYVAPDGDTDSPSADGDSASGRRKNGRGPTPFSPIVPRPPVNSAPPADNAGAPAITQTAPHPEPASPTTTPPPATAPPAPAPVPAPIPNPTTVAPPTDPGTTTAPPPPSIQLNTPLGSLTAQVAPLPALPPPPQLPELSPDQMSTLASLAPTVMSSLLTLPTAMLGATMSVMGALTAMRAQFGSGTPYVGDPSTIAPDQLYGSLDAGMNTGTWAGQGTGAYSGAMTDQTATAQAIIDLDRQLRVILESSAGNARDGRARIDAIIDKTDAALIALAPVANTIAGQAAIVQIISQAITQGTAVVNSGVAATQADANAVNSLSGTPRRRSRAQLVSSHVTPTHRGHTRADPDTDTAIEQALDHLGITDPRARENWKRGYRVLVERESGGNPNAINLTDSNAAADNPSQGAAQTTLTTFKSYHVPGTSTDPNDPTADIAASMNYVMDRYDVSPDGSDLAAKVQQADPTRSPKGY
ncbi:DUF4226 domain-containing protein [Aldersonia sp. NBC_00410]|uniref:DUF4226 domain-containing protein n=1 Tax=Aldersonia sp. NBC_00410 TaxID=2975954 RepID=UPI0022596E88|nr:DUF4226 domain-containing protein [Aldersonia sp. NBC_00410]MCX5046263.1 DUF4226 domain-containing protein [Aldersonia sp. NBC_00410]